jgi:hypothetical protein
MSNHLNHWKGPFIERNFHSLSTEHSTVVKRALALRPRGTIPNDVLALSNLRLSGHCLQLEWRARDIHPWDRDLPDSLQAELFSIQALQGPAR